MSLISIVIPVRNMADQLAGCLEQMLIYREYIKDVIIMDCCSTDDIDPVILSCRDRLPIQYIREQDGGIYDAFNKGANLATADLIFFMGADDRVRAGLFLSAQRMPPNVSIMIGGITINDQPEQWRPGIMGFRLCFRNIPHQGMLIRKRLICEHQYSLNYPLLADYAWNIENYWKISESINHIGEIFAEWTPGGASYQAKDYRFSKDKALLIASNAPFLVRTAYAAFKLFSKLIRSIHVKY